jgi:hypothetical protein
MLTNQLLNNRAGGLLLMGDYQTLKAPHEVVHNVTVWVRNGAKHLVASEEYAKWHDDEWPDPKW